MRRALRLAAIPIVISAGVSLLRLAGELLHWSETWWSPETGGIAVRGFTWVVGITWLPVLFGPYFAVALWKQGERPPAPARALVLALGGLIAAVLGLRLLVPLVPLPFPQILLVIWSIMALAGALQAFGWTALFRALLSYALGSRGIVAIVMFFAMQGNWGTHYDFVGMPAPFQMPLWPRFFWLALVPQLVFWSAFTIVLGSLTGSLAAVYLSSRGRHSQQRAASGAEFTSA